MRRFTLTHGMLYRGLTALSSRPPLTLGSALLVGLLCVADGSACEEQRGCAADHEAFGALIFTGDRDDERRKRDQARRESSPERRRGGRSSRRGPSHEDSRKLWESLSGEEKAALGELFKSLKSKNPSKTFRLLERLSKLPAEERLAEIGRARAQILEEEANWKRVENEIRNFERRSRKKFEMPAELTAKLEGVSDRKARERIVREFFHEQFKESRRKTIESLPESMRERVDSLAPREQAAFLRKYRGLEQLKAVFEDHRARFRAMRYDAEQIRTLLALEEKPEAERSRPEFFPESAWKRWGEIKSYERVRVLKTIVRLHTDEEGGHKRPPSRKESRKPRGESRKPGGADDDGADEESRGSAERDARRPEEGRDRAPRDRAPTDRAPGSPTGICLDDARDQK